MKGDKHWANTWTEIEDLGNGKRGATISVGHRVFFDKADGNKPKKHKLTDERPAKDYILIQSAKCCVEIYPYYAKYFDVQHEEVRLYEERWVVQRLFAEPDDWRDVDAYNPIITVEEYSEPAGDVVKVTITYDTDYGTLTVEYFQRDGNALKHNVTFKNTSGSTETFRVLQKWAGIVGARCNGKDIPVVEDAPYFAFYSPDKPQKKFNITENLWSMVFNLDGSEKTEQCLKRPVIIEAHAQGMKADFIYGDWVLAHDERLEIDPDTATLDNPTEDGELRRSGVATGEAAARTACLADTTSTKLTGGSYPSYGGKLDDIGGGDFDSYAYRSYVEWPISTLAGATLTANPVFKYHGALANATAGEINPISGQPSVVDNEVLWADIASGTAYVDPFNLVVAASQSQDLGASAKTDLQAAIDAERTWFAIGFQSPDDECPEAGADIRSAFYSEEKTDAADPKPTLYVEYGVGWTGKISGVVNPAKVMGVDVANIAKVKGVASA